MIKQIFFLRHAELHPQWCEDDAPWLSSEGRKQSKVMAEVVKNMIGSNAEVAIWSPCAYEEEDDEMADVFAEILGISDEMREYKPVLWPDPQYAISLKDLVHLRYDVLECPFENLILIVWKDNYDEILEYLRSIFLGQVSFRLWDEENQVFL